mmetsp:Transcript_82197/g.266367  ORF Transcript_82197/g.266367 Transcript_82197/m.266367 type:complete len:206 (-) Transcript_82197:235-852(-)
MVCMKASFLLRNSVPRAVNTSHCFLSMWLLKPRMEARSRTPSIANHSRYVSKSAMAPSISSTVSDASGSLANAATPETLKPARISWETEDHSFCIDVNASLMTLLACSMGKPFPERASFATALPCALRFTKMFTEGTAAVRALEISTCICRYCSRRCHGAFEGSVSSGAGSPNQSRAIARARAGTSSGRALPTCAPVNCWPRCTQ